MPTKRKGALTSEDDEDYRSKRDRNNQAVKRSRVKSKQRTEQTQAKVSELRIKNQVLEEKIKSLTKDLQFLKDLFLSQAHTKEMLTNPELRRLLADDDEAEDVVASTSKS